MPGDPVGVVLGTSEVKKVQQVKKPAEFSFGMSLGVWLGRWGNLLILGGLPEGMDGESAVLSRMCRSFLNNL